MFKNSSPLSGVATVPTRNNALPQDETADSELSDDGSRPGLSFDRPDGVLGILDRIEGATGMDPMIMGILGAYPIFMGALITDPFGLFAAAPSVRTETAEVVRHDQTSEREFVRLRTAAGRMYVIELIDSQTGNKFEMPEGDTGVAPAALRRFEIGARVTFPTKVNGQALFDERGIGALSADALTVVAAGKRSGIR